MRKTQIVLATGEVYDVEDKGEKRILIPVGSSGAGGHQKPDQTENDGFMNIPEGIDEELPFN